MSKKSRKGYFFRYLMIGILVAILGMIRIPIEEIIQHKFPNNLEISTQILIHYGLKVSIGIGYYLLGYRYYKILNNKELDQKESLKWRYKILIIIGIITMEDVLLLALSAMFDEVGSKVLGLIIYCGLQYALAFLIKICALLCIASLLINETNNNNLKLRVKIFTSPNIILLAMVISIIGGSVNYFLTIYINPFLHPFAWFKYGVYTNCLVEGILTTCVYLYVIYRQNKLCMDYRM
ncbi:MAG: hypothetical protein AB9856_02700 [Cellulosilyticaceae bacterium]